MAYSDVRSDLLHGRDLRRPVMPRTPGRSRRTARRLGPLAVALALITGGCMPPDADPAPDDTPVLVTIDEKEALGYDQPEAWRNPDLQRLVNDNRDQIHSVVQPYVEAKLGRRVEMTGIQATYPYRAVEVGWRTVDEPLVAGSEYAFPDADGTLRSEAYIGASGTALSSETVNGIYLMAYRDEFATVLADLLEAHPEFRGGLPPGYTRQYNLADPVFRVSLVTPLSASDDGELRAAINSAHDILYEQYLDNPQRTSGEWRKIVDKVAGGLPVSLSARFVLADSSTQLSEEATRRLASDLRDHPLIASFGAWDVFTFSSLIERETNRFDREFIVSSDAGKPEWLVWEYSGGATVHR